jgi:hypothetical protein
MKKKLNMVFVICAFCVFHTQLLRAASTCKKPYNSGSDLWHLDFSTPENTSINSVEGHTAMLISQGAEIDTVEKRLGTGSLYLTGGKAIAENIKFKGNPRSFELFIKVKDLPDNGKYSCIFSMISNQNKKDEEKMSLYINHTGELKLKYIYRDDRLQIWNRQNVMQFPQKKIKPGKWTHVSIIFLLYEYNMIRVMIDGEILDEDQMSTHGAWEVKLLLGNSAKGDQPFYGWIDEVRIAHAKTTDKWQKTEPRSVPNSQVSSSLFLNSRFLPEKDLLFYLPFDGSLQPSVFKGEKLVVNSKNNKKKETSASADLCKRSPQNMKQHFGPGVRGKAFGVDGEILYYSEGNIMPSSGTISLWFYYKGDIRKNLKTIFKIGKGWGFMFRGSHGFYCEKGNLRVAGEGSWRMNMGKPLAEEWNHMALSWKGEWIHAYLNGEQINSFLIPGGLKPLMQAQFGIGDVWDKDGKEINNYVDELMIFRRALSSLEIRNIYRHALNKEPMPLESRHISLEPCLGKNKLIVTVDQEIPGITPGKNIFAKLMDMDGILVSEQKNPRILSGSAEFVFSTKKLSKGNYRVEITQKNSNDEMVFTDVQNYKHYEFSWLKEHVGESDKVLSPWIPLKTKGDTIKVWGRTIQISGLALPKQISLKTGNLLAQPAFFEIETSKKNLQFFSGEENSPHLESTKSTRAVYTGTFQNEQIKLNIRNETEYDGCSKITLQIAPGIKTEEITRLTLVIPIAAEFAHFINAKDKGFCNYYMIGALPKAKGRVFGSYIIPQANARLKTEADTMALLSKYNELEKLHKENKAIPEELRKFKISVGHVSSGSFIPYVWVGSPEGGLCWFADTDRDWVRSNSIDTPAAEIRRNKENGIAELRINFIAAPVKLKRSRKIVFGMISTPVRPLPAGWRKRYWQNPIIIGFGKEWTAGRFYKNRGCFGAYQGEPYPMDWDRARWYTDVYGRIGDSQVPYFEFSNIHKSNFPKYMEREWRVQPTAWQEQGGIFPSRSYADWWCYHFLLYRNIASPDGVYFDNVYLKPSLYEHSHGAWRDKHGDLQATYNLWDLRNMLKRVRTIFQDTGIKQSWIQLHMTHYNLINAMGFADILYDGEDMIQTPKKNAKSFLDCWSLDRITAIDSPHTWGIPTRFVSNVRGTPTEWDKIHDLGYQTAVRAEVGSLLLVDCYSDQLNESMSNTRNDLENWGVLKEDCSFIGYWKNIFKTDDSDIKVSAYNRPNAILLVIQNRNRKKNKIVNIIFDPKEVLNHYAINDIKISNLENKEQKEYAKNLQSSFNYSLRIGPEDNWLIKVGPIPAQDFCLINVSKESIKK